MSKIQSDWRDFEDAVETDSGVSRQGPQCKTCKLLQRLSGEGADAVEAALNNPSVTSASIRRVLFGRVEDKFIPSAYSISRHRRGDCRRGLE